MSLIGLIGTILIGVIFGAVAKVLTPGRDLAGLIVTSMLGIAGALLAAYLGQALSLYDANAAASFLAAAVGAFYLSLHFQAHLPARGTRALVEERPASDMGTREPSERISSRQLYAAQHRPRRTRHRGGRCLRVKLTRAGRRYTPTGPDSTYRTISHRRFTPRSLPSAAGDSSA